MMTSRDFTSIINFILDNICPPILRDCYPLMFPIYYLAYGKQTARLLKYKDRYPFLSEAEYAEYYACAATTRLSARPTDLNEAGLRFVLSHIPAGSVCLDAGSGRGFLAKNLISRKHRIRAGYREAQRFLRGRRLYLCQRLRGKYPFSGQCL